jgi:hypothetical protein
VKSLRNKVIIGAALGGFVAAALFMAYKQREASRMYVAHHELYCDAFMASEDQKAACKEEGASDKDYLPWWYELIRWPEGITTWALVATLGAITWQATLMGTHAEHLKELAAAATDSAKAAKDTAEAVRGQTDHMVASERAWIVAHSTMEGYRPSEVEKPVFYWAIKNTGKTAARLIEAQCVYELLNVEQLQALPEEPVYHLPTEFNGMPLSPGGSMSRSANLIQPPHSSALDQLSDEVKVIRIRLSFLLAYGYVRYLDVFGNARESRFIEKYIWLNEEVRGCGFQPYLDAPPEYTKCT